MKIALITLLLPPGLIIALCLAALYCFKSMPRRAYVLLLAAIILGWVFTSSAMGRVLSITLISQVAGPTTVAPDEADLIVVLTGGMDYAGEIGWLPKQESYRRGIIAYELQERVDSRVPVLISGGRTAGARYPSEALVLQRYFDRHQARLTPTLLEESAQNTYESALQVASIAQGRNAKRIFLVTSEVHMLRSLAAFRGRGMDPVPFPVITLPRGPLGLRDILPSWEGAELNAKALYEVYGLIGYTLGGKISVGDIFYK